MKIEEAINVFKGFKFTPREMKAVSLAIESMEKQIPNKPTNKAFHEWNGRVIYDIAQYRCPSCNSQLKSGLGSSSKYRNNFCNKCGQAIDWSEVKR